MDTVTLILFVVGIGLLIVGAEFLVKGASNLAMAVGISPLIIGLTVVAFGTSSPELAVSVQASLDGQADIALGNVVGSNIFNVLLILGLSALVAPLIVSRQLIRLDVPVMIGVSVLLFLMAIDGKISRTDGAILFAGMVSYTGFLIWMGRREGRANGNGQAIDAAAGDPIPDVGKRSPWFVQIAYVAGGLVLLVLGSRWLVDGAIEIAEAAGVSELVIGLTIVAAGTSLPEVATSILASIRGQRDIAVGNVVGSNIFNILGVLGLAGVTSGSGINVPDSMTAFDMPVMLAVALACLPIFFSGWLIARWEGAVFLAYYVAYTLYLVLNATEHDALHTYRTVLIWFVIPLTLLTIAVVGLRALRTHRNTATPVATSA